MTGLRALVVDDNPMMRSLIEKTISASGISDIDYAGNGVEALRCYRSRHHDLILLDNIMPRMTGIEFLTELRADPALQKTHVIMVTGIVDQSLIARIRNERIKINDLIVKPFDIKKLQHKIVGLVARCRQNNDPIPTTADRRVPAPSEISPTLNYCLINRGALAILEFKGNLTNDNKTLINAALKELQYLHSDLIVVDINEVNEIDDFGYGTIMVINGYLETLGKQACISLDDCPMKNRIEALGITQIIPSRDRAADSLDI